MTPPQPDAAAPPAAEAAVNVWTPAPCLGQFSFERERVRALWNELHAAECLPCPTNDALLDGWALFHTGLFERAKDAGALAGMAGAPLACRASACHAALVEASLPARVQHLQNLHMRACTYAAFTPRCPETWFWQGWALMQYTTIIGAAAALAQGLVMPTMTALRTALMLGERHAWAHATLGELEAEVIGALGAFTAHMSHGIRQAEALDSLHTALRLAPNSPAVLCTSARALRCLGSAHLDEARALLERAATHTPLDASEWLWGEHARALLAR
ncbi:MAG: hypothetical protein IJR28_04005 [Ottowia sp.]|nr:hypothetical protein [Ottowia sp.]